MTVSHGGVGRNLAQCLFGLGARPVLITSGVPRGPGLAPSSLDTRVSPGCKASAAYLAVLDSEGECKIGFGDMAAHAHITPDWVLQNRAAVEEAPLVVIDGNIPGDTVVRVLDLAQELDTPVFFEPTDIRKATKPFLTKHSRSLSFASPNLNELIAIASNLGYMQTDSTLDIDKILEMSSFVTKYVDNLIITMGEKGVLVLRKGNEDQTFFSQHGGKILYKKPNNDKLEGRLYTVKKLLNVLNVSGAGDCLAGGFILAMLRGEEEQVCMSVGFEAARMALLSNYAVPQLFFDLSHHCWSTRTHCVTLL